MILSILMVGAVKPGYATKQVLGTKLHPSNSQTRVVHGLSGDKVLEMVLVLPAS